MILIKQPKEITIMILQELPSTGLVLITSIYFPNNSY